jgi:peptide/nickel transport system substrate-binding protein
MSPNLYVKTRSLFYACFVFLILSQFNSFNFHTADANSSGVLVYGRSGDSVSLDPAKETDGESLSVADNIFENLVRFKLGTTEIEPELAERWTVSADGLEYTFFLRKGVVFHDSTPFDSDAVIFSFLRQNDTKHEAYGYSKTWDYWNDMGMDTLVKSVEKIDSHTVKMVLSRIEAPFLANLAMRFAAIVSPTAVRKFKQDFSKNPVGTGPYRFVNWSRGEKIVLEAFKNYWSEKPKIMRVVFKTIPDGSARLNAFLAKEIHIMNQPTPDQLKTIQERRKDANILTGSGMNVAYLAMNNQKKPFDNVKVRVAMNLAINKEAILKSIYSGMGVAAINPIPPTLWGYNKNIKGYAFDVAKAKEMLKESGFPNGFKTTLYYMPVSRPYMPDAKKVAEAIQSDLKNIGVIAELQTYEWATYLDKTKKGEHEMALMGWTGDNGDPDNFLRVLLSEENTKPPASNIAFYKNNELTKILNDAKSVLDMGKRTQLYQKAQEIIFKDAPWVPIAHSKTFVPLDSKVKGFVLTPNETRHFKTVWFEK